MADIGPGVEAVNRASGKSAGTFRDEEQSASERSAGQSAAIEEQESA